ncbi:MAG TPA: peptidyl-prolyl cis-trans isomerase [Myxococcales bacterium]|nr:peptidyl-prolyl cis-trans isomerase [Myxococcales bacterium]
MNTRNLTLLCGLLAALSLSACKKDGGAAKSGPVVATVGNDTITADEMKKRLEETSPFLRARYNTLERKKEFLDNLIRNELLAQEAEKQGLDKSPAVREQMKRAMIQELIKKQLDERLAGGDIADADLKKFYDAHLDDFQKPERARVFHIFLPAKDAKEKAAAKTKMAGILKDIDAREKKGEANAFQLTATKESKDALTAPMGGDLRFSTKEELAKNYNSELADAAFNLKSPNEKSGVVETSTGVELLKLQVKTVALNRSFEDSKESIRGRMARERRSHEYDEWVKKLREQTKVTVNDDELAKITVEGAGGAQPGMPGMPGMQAPSVARATGVSPQAPQMARPPAAPQAPSTTSSQIGK